MKHFLFGGILMFTFAFSSPAISSEYSIVVETNRVVQLCYKMMRDPTTNHGVLSQAGYTVKKKRRYTKYNKSNPSNGLFGGQSVQALISNTGCRIIILGLGNDKGNQIYSSLQQQIEADGFKGKVEKRGRHKFFVYRKGQENIYVRAKDNGPTIEFNIAHFD